MVPNPPEVKLKRSIQTIIYTG